MVSKASEAKRKELAAFYNEIQRRTNNYQAGMAHNHHAL